MQADGRLRRARVRRVLRVVKGSESIVRLL